MESPVNPKPGDVQRDGKREPGDGQEEPMLTHPEDCFGIAGMPGGALVNREKTPRVFIVSMIHN